MSDKEFKIGEIVYIPVDEKTRCGPLKIVSKPMYRVLDVTDGGTFYFDAENLVRE